MLFNTWRACGVLSVSLRGSLSFYFFVVVFSNQLYATLHLLFFSPQRFFWCVNQRRSYSWERGAGHVPPPPPTHTHKFTVSPMQVPQLEIILIVKQNGQGKSKFYFFVHHSPPPPPIIEQLLQFSHCCSIPFFLQHTLVRFWHVRCDSVISQARPLY